MKKKYIWTVNYNQGNYKHLVVKTATAVAQQFWVVNVMFLTLMIRRLSAKCFIVLTNKIQCSIRTRGDVVAPF